MRTWGPAGAELIRHIQTVTSEVVFERLRLPVDADQLQQASAVLFLIGRIKSASNKCRAPCLILNKRSRHVAQAGDLCCPGGGLEPGIDPWLAKIMRLPGLPMWRWPYWRRFKQVRHREGRTLRILLSTALRESVEEMRLNPFGVRFLGALPREELVMFQRRIYPFVAWLPSQRRFHPNWEVEKIVKIPLHAMMHSDSWIRYRLKAHRNPPPAMAPIYDAIAFRHQNRSEAEILWGATCRMTLGFLKLIFGFQPPDIETLPVVEAMIQERYMRPDARGTD